MALSLEQLQAAFKKNDTSNNEGGNRPNNYYLFWNMKDDEKATVRFLPDTNPDNPMGFLVEKLMHNLEINGEKKKIPCLKMYGEECPICDVSRAYYKEEGKKSPNGKKYWRKKQHIAQALIVSDPLAADEETGETSEGKVRFLNLGWQLYEKIKAEFESGELDANPVEFKGGCNFNIGKASQGGEYSTYALTSGFARRSTDLTDDEVALVEDQMVDLSTLIPPKPDLEKVEAMLNAALTGAEYAEPSKSNDAEPAPAKAEPVPAKADEPAKAEPVAEAAPAPEEGDDPSADDILAKIRARRAKSE